MLLAESHRARLIRDLAEVHTEWPFEDRVLVWLADHWTEDVAGFHSGRAPEMSAKFTPEQLRHLDQHYRDKLAVRLKTP